MNRPKDVAAAIIQRDDRVFVTRRGPDQAMAGLWEFPGGKVEPGETVQACIVRELAEELDIACEAGAEFMRNLHVYPGGSINLIAVHVRMTGESWELRVHDEARWVPVSELETLNLAPADVPIARALAGRTG